MFFFSTNLKPVAGVPFLVVSDTAKTARFGHRQIGVHTKDVRVHMMTYFVQKINFTHRICQDKRHGRLIFRSKKHSKPIGFMYSPLWQIIHHKPSVSCTPPFENIAHQNSSVSCTPPFDKSSITSHRFHVLPPLKNSPIKTHWFCVLPPLKNHCLWWTLISGWAFISTNTVFLYILLNSLDQFEWNNKTIK